MQERHNSITLAMDYVFLVQTHWYQDLCDRTSRYIEMGKQLQNIVM